MGKKCLCLILALSIFAFVAGCGTAQQPFAQASVTNAQVPLAIATPTYHAPASTYAASAGSVTAQTNPPGVPFLGLVISVEHADMVTEAESSTFFYNNADILHLGGLPKDVSLAGVGLEVATPNEDAQAMAQAYVQALFLGQRGDALALLSPKTRALLPQKPDYIFSWMTQFQGCTLQSIELLGAAQEGILCFAVQHTTRGGQADTAILCLEPDGEGYAVCFGGIIRQQPIVQEVVAQSLLHFVPKSILVAVGYQVFITDITNDTQNTFVMAQNATLYAQGETSSVIPIKGDLLAGETRTLFCVFGGLRGDILHIFIRGVQRVGAPAGEAPYELLAYRQT